MSLISDITDRIGLCVFGPGPVIMQDKYNTYITSSTSNWSYSSCPSSGRERNVWFAIDRSYMHIRILSLYSRPWTCFGLIVRFRNGKIHVASGVQNVLLVGRGMRMRIVPTSHLQHLHTGTNCHGENAEGRHLLDKCGDWCIFQRRGFLTHKNRIILNNVNEYISCVWPWVLNQARTTIAK